MYAIEAENLGKQYRKRGVGPQTLFGSLREAFSGKEVENFWAIREASFKIPKGKTIGVIGPNGAGKSSTLGLAAGTISPTTGNIKVEGRVSSLLELGAGFHPDLSGRENVYLNAALLGIPREDIRKRFDHIVEFSGLGEFIDMPVKNYSSGMYVRLGFAVATEIDPDVLLIDEVLAVGDVAFQLKCLDRIRQFQKKGKTLMFVSHALQTVEEFCDEAFLIHGGHLVEQGPPDEVVLKFIREYMGEGGGIFTQEFGTREIEFGEVQFVDSTGNNSGLFTAGQVMHVDIPYVAHKRVEKPVFGYTVKTGNGMVLYGTNTQLQKYEIPFVEGEGTVRLSFDPLILMRGNYFLSLSIHSWDHGTQFHRREDWYPFAVRQEDDTPGLVQLTSSWSPG